MTRTQKSLLLKSTIRIKCTLYEGTQLRNLKNNRYFKKVYYRAAIERANSAQTFGVILGTLGRQGNTQLLDRMTKLLSDNGKKYFILLLSEIFPDKVRLLIL